MTNDIAVNDNIIACSTTKRHVTTMDVSLSVPGVFMAGSFLGYERIKVSPTATPRQSVSGPL